MLNRSLHDRLWMFVDKRGPDECWPWTRTCASNGYGSLRFNYATIRTHRLAFELSTGIAPGERFVCHRCDNPPCCNPAHLFLGDAATNNADTRAKGRENRPVGERVGTSKITAEIVTEIRRRHAGGERQCDIARSVGLPRYHVHQIVSGRRWKHLLNTRVAANCADDDDERQTRTNHNDNEESR